MVLKELYNLVLKVTKLVLVLIEEIITALDQVVLSLVNVEHLLMTLLGYYGIVKVKNQETSNSTRTIFTQDQI